MDLSYLELEGEGRGIIMEVTRSFLQVFIIPGRYNFGVKQKTKSISEKREEKK